MLASSYHLLREPTDQLVAQTLERYLKKTKDWRQSIKEPYLLIVSGGRIITHDVTCKRCLSPRVLSPPLFGKLQARPDSPPLPLPQPWSYLIVSAPKVLS